MSIIQKVKWDHVHFGEIVQFVVLIALKDGNTSDRIDITAPQIVRQRRSFLAHVGNQSNLISFLVGEMRKPDYTKHLNGNILFVTTDDKCYKFTMEEHQKVLQLQSTHEETDDRLFLHAAHAAHTGYPAVVISSEYTNVFIMALAFQTQIASKLFLKCGTKERKRTIDITNIAVSVGAYLRRGRIGCMLTQVEILSAHLPASANSEHLNCLGLANRSM